MRHPASIGGRAAAQGIDFEERVAAWSFVQLMAGTDLQRFGTPPDWRATAVWMQAPVTAGDIVIEHSRNGALYIQAKYRKSAVPLNGSPIGLLGLVFGQFAQQFVAKGDGTSDANPWSRGFDASRDRFVLVVPTSAGLALAQRTAALLNALREPDGWRNAEARLNAAELRLRDILWAAASQALISAGVANPAVEPFLACISVAALDMDDPGAGAAEARQLLESAVLAAGPRPGGHAAWCALLQIARESNRAGARLGISDVAGKLQAAGFRLRAPRTFEASILQLQRLTEKNLRRLRRYAELRVDAGPAIEIPRECAAALCGVLNVNRVVIGQPGAGKSGVIYQVCRALRRKSRHLVLLLADDLQASSERPLREVLGLDADLPDVLAAWPGAKPAHLVIDALDAARDAKIAHQLKAAMGAVIAEKGRWRVLASMRRFDLKHSPETRDLFPGPAVDGYRDPEFGETAHFDVPEFTNEELASAGKQHAAIGTLLTAARRYPDTFRLLKQPFNLSLACELLRAQIPVPEIVPFETNTVLLDRFWDRRVNDAQPRGAEREAVLARMVDTLVASLAMRIKDDRQSDRSIVTELAQRYVLDPGAFGDGEIRFSHHLLHDYGVSRLLFRSNTPEELVAKLQTKAELSVYARQSLLLHFDYLWDRDQTREVFWATSLALLGSPLPLVARILSTECAVMNIARWPDLAPLVQRVAAGDEAAQQMLRYCVSGFLDVEDAEQLARVAPVWAQLAVHLAEKLPDHHWQVHLLLFKLLPERGGLDPALADATNRAARLLAGILQAKTQPEQRTGPDFLTALRTLCRTGFAAPEETAATLRPLFRPEYAEQFGDRVYWVIAGQIKHLIASQPGLVRDFYVAAYANESKAEGTEPLGTSKILPMQVNRRDNYRMAHHSLHADFPAFFAAAPVMATMAVLQFLPAFREREHPLRGGARQVRQRFRFRGRKCHLIGDFSSIWASGSSSDGDGAVAVLRAARDGWVDLAQKANPVLEQILDLIAGEAELAVIWAMLLEAGRRAPDTLGIRLIPLLSAPAILTGYDTQHPAAALLAAVFPKLKRSVRAEIERVVVALPKSRWKDNAGKLQRSDKWRGLYLNQISPGLMVTAAAKTLYRVLAAEKELRKNEPTFSSWGSTGQIDWPDYVPSLREVDLKTDAHLAARDWEQKLRGFSRADGKKQTAESVTGFWPEIIGAYQFAATQSPPGLHPDVAQLVWAHLVGVAEQIVRSGVMPEEPARQALLREILLRGARDPQPEVEADTEAAFARGPSWGSPCPRIDAAEALIVWPRETRANDDELRTVLRTLAADLHPAVRYQIAGACNSLYDVDRPFMWELIRDRTAKEHNPGVWSGWLSAIDRIAPAHQDEAAGLFFEYLRRFPRTEEAHHDPADYAVGGLSDLFIRFGHPRATEYVMAMVNDPVRRAHYLGLLCHNFRATLAIGLEPGATDFQRKLHARGREFFLTLVRNGRAALEALLAQARAGTPPPEADVRAILQLLDSLNMQVFFASGAHDAKKLEEPPPPLAAFWRETKPIIDELVQLPSTHIAYHLTETLEYLISADPAEVFRCLVQVVANTKADGFALEHLAVGVITRIVERYLADYGALFTEQPELMTGLLQVLDVFADVGWPEARRLIRNLSQLYR
jgi:hypothetical protein